MPKDYSRGKIYKIVCNITGKIYIGSTCEPTLARRLANHVQCFKYCKNGIKKYITSFEIIEGNDYYIELLELVPCNINEELLARERYFINNIKCVNRNKNLNRTQEDKKEAYTKYNKEYSEKNKDKLIEYHQQYTEKNKDKLKEKNKVYREKNKDKLKEYNKVYREKNKDKLKEYNKERYCKKTLKVNKIDTPLEDQF